MDYVIHILITIGIYVILSVSYNLLIGYTGIFAICQAAFYGIGSYITALLLVDLGWSFIPAMVMGMIGAGVISLIIGIPGLRVHWDYMVILSFGFQFMVYHVLMNWRGLTHGPSGVGGISKPQIFGFTFDSIYSFLALTVVFAIIVVLVTKCIGSPPFGRVLKGIREDEVAVKSLGKNVTQYKVSAFVACGALAAVAGALFASHITYIVPYNFTLEESFFILCLVVLGGAGNLKGAIVGAVILVAIPQLLGFLQVSSVILGSLRQLIYGVMLVVFMLFRPQGIIGEKPTKFKGLAGIGAEGSSAKQE